MTDLLRQSWQDELSMIVGVYNNIIFTGNVEDLHYDQTQKIFMYLRPYLKQQLKGYEFFEYRISDISDEDEKNIIRRIKNGENDLAVCTIINCSSQYVAIKQNDNKIASLYSGIKDELNNSFIDSKGNMSMIILICDNLSNIPNWYYTTSKIINLPSPNNELRRIFIEQNYKDNLTEEEKRELVNLSNAFRIKDLFVTIQLKNRNNKLSVSGAVDLYKYGIKTNPWKEMRKKLENEPLTDYLKKSIVGNEEIIDYINKVFIKKALNMQGIMDDDHSTRPSGLFFVFGPSGTGKTEFAKQITKYLKGDINSMIRIDCSEYAEQHDIEKLIGSPIGYIGCEKGGILTEGISRDPFAVVVIDEFEKANSALHDMFLQVMEDGRITDGMGKTVDCSQAIFFFTGNLGITRGGESIFSKKEDREYVVKPIKEDGQDTTKEEIKVAVNESMRKLLKPEFINRIGEKNVQVTRFINEAEIKNTIDMKLEVIKENMLARNKIELNISKNVNNFLYEICNNNDIRLYGHRGVVNEIDMEFVQPLAIEIFNQKIYSGSINVDYENSVLTVSK